LVEGLKVSSDIERLKPSIKNLSSLIENVDIFTAEEFDGNVFSINQGQDFIGSGRSFEPISFEIPAELVIPDSDKSGRFILNLLNEIGHDPDFDKTLLALIRAETWSNASTIPSISKIERAQAVSETVAVFIEHVKKHNESVGFTDASEDFLNYFQEEIESKYSNSGVSELIFNSSSIPFSSHYAKIPFYTHIHIKLYLLLYITFKQYILKELLKSEGIKAMKKRGSGRFLAYLEKIDMGEEVNSSLLMNFINENIDMSPEMIKQALEMTAGDTSRAVAKSIKLLFSTAHKPINKYLALMGFGKLTKMP